VKSKSKTPIIERCALCDCILHRGKDYAADTPSGRAHATKHHVVAERFFGRSANRRGTQRLPMFPQCPWGFERETALFCYECHELLIHNPTFLPADIKAFAELVRARGLHETRKPSHRRKIAGRVRLFQEIVSAGIHQLLATARSTNEGRNA
jgi:hypothetical protein